jgi:hypothetical protein
MLPFPLTPAVPADSPIDYDDEDDDYDDDDDDGEDGNNEHGQDVSSPPTIDIIHIRRPPTPVISRRLLRDNNRTPTSSSSSLSRLLHHRDDLKLRSSPFRSTPTKTTVMMTTPKASSEERRGRLLLWRTGTRKGGDYGFSPSGYGYEEEDCHDKENEEDDYSMDFMCRGRSPNTSPKSAAPKSVVGETRESGMLSQRRGKVVKPLKLL